MFDVWSLVTPANVTVPNLMRTGELPVVASTGVTTTFAPVAVWPIRTSRIVQTTCSPAAMSTETPCSAFAMYGLPFLVHVVDPT